MTDEQISSPLSPISGNTYTKSSRGATRLRYLLLRCATSERIPVNIHVNTDITSEPNVESFSSYLGVVAQEKILILVPSWEHVTKNEKDMIWQNIIVSIYFLLTFYCLYLLVRHTYITITHFTQLFIYM